MPVTMMLTSPPACGTDEPAQGQRDPVHVLGARVHGDERAEDYGIPLDGNLVFECIGERGIDPPALRLGEVASPAGRDDSRAIRSALGCDAVAPSAARRPGAVLLPGARSTGTKRVVRTEDRALDERPGGNIDASPGWGEHPTTSYGWGDLNRAAVRPSARISSAAGPGSAPASSIRMVSLAPRPSGRIRSWSSRLPRRRSGTEMWRTIFPDPPAGEAFNPGPCQRDTSLWRDGPRRPDREHEPVGDRPLTHRIRQALGTSRRALPSPSGPAGDNRPHRFPRRSPRSGRGPRRGRRAGGPGLSLATPSKDRRPRATAVGWGEVR